MIMPDHSPNDRIFNTTYSSNTIPHINQMRNQLSAKNLSAFEVDVKKALGSNTFSPGDFLRRLDSWDVTALKPNQLQALDRCYIAMNEALKIWEGNKNQIRREQRVQDPEVEVEVYDESQAIEKCLSVAIQAQRNIESSS